MLEWKLKKDILYYLFFDNNYLHICQASICIPRMQYNKPSRQAAMDAFQKADYETAFREFSILLQNYSKDPLYKYYSGVCLVKMSRNPNDASGFLEDAINGSLDIKSIPDDAWFYLGRSQQMMGRFPDAIESYNNFENKAGRKIARSYGIDTYIQECNQGKGTAKRFRIRKGDSFRQYSCYSGSGQSEKYGTKDCFTASCETGSAKE